MQCDVMQCLMNVTKCLGILPPPRCKAKITGELLLARRRLDEERSKSESLSRRKEITIGISPLGKSWMFP